MCEDHKDSNNNKNSLKHRIYKIQINIKKSICKIYKVFFTFLLGYHCLLLPYLYLDIKVRSHEFHAISFDFLTESKISMHRYVPKILLNNIKLINFKK